MTPDKIKELRSLLAECQQLRDTMATDLADWHAICASAVEVGKAFGKVQAEFDQVKQQLRDGQATLVRRHDAAAETYNRLRERILEITGEATADDWWRTGTEPPEFDE